MTTPALPPDFGFAVSRRAKVCAGGREIVGAGTVLRLRPPAAALVARAPLSVGHDPVAARVARRLLDVGVADPWWPDPPAADRSVHDVTVVVPTRDRAVAVDGLLAALPRGVPVVVVDDGSRDPAALAAVAAAHGARLEVHPDNRGPAAARNTGLRAARTPYVAFVDSDVRPDRGWLAALRRHLDDPAVAVVGPRVLGRPAAASDSWVDRYEQARSSLDLGPEPAAVRVQGAVAYLPGACLLVRREALGAGFEEAMRSGEDVDLVWRLLGAGWRVRYEPAATVRHDHRTRVLPWLRRKAFYGSSAAPLAARHGGAVAPLVLTPASAAFALAVLAQRRWSAPVAAGALALTVAVAGRRLRETDRPLRTAATLAAESAVATVWQTADALVRHHWPLAAVWATASRRGRRALLVAALAEGVADWRRTRPDQGLAPYLLAHRLDDLAYGAGVWAGAVQQRSARALLPDVRWRSDNSSRGRRN